MVDGGNVTICTSNLRLDTDMQRVIDWFKKYWAVVVGALAFLAGAIAFGGRKFIPIDKPPEEPPKPETATDHLDAHKKDKETSDAKIDGMSTDQLVDDINSKYR